MTSAGRLRNLLLGILVATLVAVAAVTYTSLRLAGNAVDEQVRGRVASTASASAAAVDQEMLGLSQVVSSYAGRPYLVGAFARGRPARYDHARMRLTLRDLARARRGIVVVFLTDTHGRLIDILPATPSIVGKSFAFRDWYRGVARSGTSYVSSAYRSAAQGHPLVVAAASYVYARDGHGRRGRPVGIIVAGYSLAHLSEFSARFARVQGVDVRIFDRRGALLAAPGGAPRRLVRPANRPLVAAALAGHARVGNERRRLVASAPVPGVRWAVTASVPGDTATAATRGLRSTLLLVALLLGLGVAAALAFAARAFRARDRAGAEAARHASVSAAVIDATRDGILMADLDGRVILANAVYERIVSEILGEPAELVERGRNMAEVGALIGQRVADPAAYRAALERLADLDEEEALDEYEVVHTGRAYLRYAAPVRDSGGEVIGRILTVRDITSEREAERLKSELVATVSHELRTPLTGILGFTELLLNERDGAPPRRDYLLTIHAEAQRLTAMINDFLDLQRIESGGFTLALEPFDMGELLRETAAAAAGQSAEHELELDVADGELVVAGDRERLRQVVGNLVSNAIKYSPAGGRVQVGASVDGSSVRIAVRDSGLGIPREQQRHIFTKFFRVDSSDTRRIGGTGLGLALCREIVEAHGGRIGFSSVEGEGSTFWFELPVGVRRDGEGLQRILVIEDEPATAALLAETLAREGFVIETTASGEEGIARAVEEPPAAVCLDISLAGAVDGWHVLGELKANLRTADVPVVVCTAGNGRSRASALGAADFVTKPFEPERLRETIARLLPQGRGDVLVVDDDASVRRLVVEALRGDGLRFREAADGIEALAAVADAMPDAIVLDLVMPSLDGFAVLERLQEDPETRWLPVVVLTARQLTPAERRSLQARALALLDKSEYSASELRRLIGLALAD